VALDPQRVRFKSKALAAAMALGGSLESPDAAPFFEALYSEWLASATEMSGAEAWLRERLVGTFASVGAAPAWIDEEPAWPFLDGRPMTFLSQTPAGPLAPGEVVYLFGARKPRGSGFEMVYRVASQFEDDEHAP
jgi:hypothetical protein